MATILKDFLLTGTPFRGLILRSEFALCAYIGVPQDHWLADMDSLEFDCHWGVTFNGEGGDGIRPAGWYWYGWDYAHAGDFLEMPPELLEHLQDHGISPPWQRGKKWTVEEVEHDIVDSAVELQAALDETMQKARVATAGLRQRDPKL